MLGAAPRETLIRQLSIFRLQGQVDAAHAALADAQNQTATAQKQLETLQNQVNAATAELTALQSQIREAKPPASASP